MLESLHVHHAAPLRVKELVDHVLSLGLLGAQAGQLVRAEAVSPVCLLHAGLTLYILRVLALDKPRGLIPGQEVRDTALLPDLDTVSGSKLDL